MKVSIIAIGDELLIGQVTDTNSGSLARIMEPYGWVIDNVAVVHDNADDIRNAIDSAFRHTDVVLTTGGLGPTKDDITKSVLRDIFGGEMVIDDAVSANIREVFAKRGIAMNELTALQALVPTSCRVIQNLVGTAPIMWFEPGDGRVLVAMPGVPFEAIRMFTDAVFPQLRERFPSDVAIEHRTVVISGISESKAAMQLDEWERSLPQSAHLAYLPQQGIISLRVDVTGSDREATAREADRLGAELADIMADYLLCVGDLTPEEALVALLRGRGLTVATAESCTGGNIAHRITMIAGCSDVYNGSVVSYANDVKIHLLGVDPSAIEAHGVVSEEVVAQMAVGVCRACGTDCAIATSGIAGPSGATPGKPVGTVCIGVATPDGVVTSTHHFPGTRDRVIDRASTTALVALADRLKK